LPFVTKTTRYNHHPSPSLLSGPTQYTTLATPHMGRFPLVMVGNWLYCKAQK
jgi:hypothetical protein